MLTGQASAGKLEPSHKANLEDSWMHSLATRCMLIAAALLWHCLHEGWIWQVEGMEAL